ncbi:MAG: TSUP family transporter, partial [Magnetococcales bacterium]|nr:TSUP family transporter [Magnetococcales bacterium]
QGWKLPLIVLTVSCMGTFAWALHLIWEHRTDLGGVNYIYALQDLAEDSGLIAHPPRTKGAPTTAVGAMPPQASTPNAGVAPQPGTLPQAGAMGLPTQPGAPAATLGQAVSPAPALPMAGMAQPVAATNPAALVRASLVSIAGFRETGANAVGELVGSGVLIGAEGYVATAAHLVQDWKQLRVRVSTPDGAKEYPARPMKIVAEHNLAVIKLATTAVFPFLPPADVIALQPGTRVTAWGDDRAGSVIAQSGAVRGTPTTVTVGKRTYQSLIPTDGLLFHWAQSGGPLVDSQYRLVGIDMVFKDEAGNAHGYFVPASLLRAHFRDVLSFPPDAGGGLGQAGGSPLADRGAAMPGPDNGTMAGFSAQPTLQTVAAILPTPAQGEVVQGAPPPGGNNQATATGPPQSRPADRWWKLASKRLEQVLYLRITDLPFDTTWMMGGDSGHLRANQIFGYPVSIFLGMLLLGFVSGVSGGMMTMGGGIIKVTGLMAIFGYGIVLVRPVAYITNIFMYGAAALRYKKAGLIDWNSVRPMVPWAMVGMVGGYYIGILLDASAIRILLGLFALSVGIKMLREIWERRQEATLRRSRGETKPVIEEEISGPAWHGMGLGSGILGLPMGVVSGILGITGGVVEVPLQRYVNRVTLRVAIANSAVLVFFASMVGSVVAMVHGGWSGAFEVGTPLIMALILLPGAYLGGMLGSWLTTVIRMDLLRWIYAIFMFIIAGRMWTE